MQDHPISQQNTFGSALRSIKSTSSLRKNTVSHLKESPASLLKTSSFSNMMASSVRITERTNLTLAQLYAQYARNPHTEYVLRLKNISPKKKDVLPAFDSWVNAFNHQYLNTQGDQIRDKSKRQGHRDEVKGEIEQNILKINKRLKQKESQFTQQSYYDQFYPLGKQQNKYSFSNYFSQCSELSNKDSSNKPEIINKVSLSNNQPINQKVSLGLKDNNREQQNLCINKKINFSNKENIRINTNIGGQEEVKVKGLQFSKKTRFKSTKRKRKV